MFRIAVVVIALAASAPVRAQSVQPAGVTIEQLEKAKGDGKDAASAVGTGGWFGGGIASGLLGNILGTGIVVAIAANSDANLTVEQRLKIANESQAYQLTYAEAYADEVRSQRKANALTGGIIGSLVVATVVGVAISHTHNTP